MAAGSSPAVPKKLIKSFNKQSITRDTTLKALRTLFIVFFTLRIPLKDTHPVSFERDKGYENPLKDALLGYKKIHPYLLYKGVFFRIP